MAGWSCRGPGRGGGRLARAWVSCDDQNHRLTDQHLHPPTPPKRPNLRNAGQDPVPDRANSQEMNSRLALKDNISGINPASQILAYRETPPTVAAFCTSCALRLTRQGPISIRSTAQVERGQRVHFLVRRGRRSTNTSTTRVVLGATDGPGTAVDGDIVRRCVRNRSVSAAGRPHGHGIRFEWGFWVEPTTGLVCWPGRGRLLRVGWRNGWRRDADPST
jgi:hypothetical protein